MKASKQTMYAVTITRIFLGLVMLIPGILKLTVVGPTMVIGMLSNIGLFAWAPIFWAWVLIISEIIFGLSVALNYQLRYTAIPPMIILTIASFTVHWTSWGNMLTHLTIVCMYWIFAAYDANKK